MKLINRLVRLFNLLCEVVFGRVQVLRGETERRVYLHWQNLNEDSRGRPRGFPWEGRAWLYVRAVKEGPRARFTLPLVALMWWTLAPLNSWIAPLLVVASLDLLVRVTKHRDIEIRWSWHFPTKSCRICLGIDSETGLGLSVALPPLSLWWSIAGVLPRRLEYDERDLSLRIHDWAIWWNIWRDDNSWDRSVPRWRNGNFQILDFLLGKQKYSNEVLSLQPVVIPMPEGSYPAIVALEEATWKRPRWFASRVCRADVTMVKPIPFPGKGESSWDCGEDAMYGQSCRARNVEEAIASVVESCLRNRRRHGGSAMMRYPSPLTLARV